MRFVLSCWGRGFGIGVAADDGEALLGKLPGDGSGRDDAVGAEWVGGKSAHDCCFAAADAAGEEESFFFGRILSLESEVRSPKSEDGSRL